MLVDKNQCCGCEACVNACKFDAIKMEYDESLFKHPVIDKEKCKKCKMCDKVCPVKQEKSENIIVNEIYAGYNTNIDELFKSASGGISYLLNEYFIKNNGVVYGVRYSDNYKSAEFMRVDDIKGLDELKSSKYVQASKNDIYKIVESDLKKSIKVLFTGLPCEVAALKSFLRKKYDNLYTCALICTGPTSPVVQKEYIEYYENKEDEKIKFFNVRSKKRGWGPPNHIEIVFENDKSIVNPFNETPFGRAFEILSRESCTDCKFKISNTSADITIGDYWGVDKKSNIYNINGVSIILFHNEKLIDIVNQIPNFKIQKITYEEALKNNQMLEVSRKNDKRKNIFIKRINKNGLIYAYKKSNPLYKTLLKKVIPRKLIRKIKGEKCEKR